MNIINFLVSVFGAASSLFGVADNTLHSKEIDRLEKRNETLSSALRQSERERLILGALLAMTIILAVISFFHCGDIHA